MISTLINRNTTIKTVKMNIAAYEGMNKERIEAYDKLQTKVSQQQIIARFAEGQVNRLHQKDLNELNKIFQKEMKLLDIEQLEANREHSKKLQKWAIEKQRTIQLEIKKLEQDFQRELTVINRNNQINLLRERKHLYENYPVKVNLLDLLGRDVFLGLNPVHIFLSPPAVENDNSSDKGFLNISYELEINFLNFIELYRNANRPVTFYSGAWKSKSYHGRTSTETLFKDLNTEPTLVIENQKKGKNYFLNIADWRENATEPNFQNITKFDWQNVLKKAAEKFNDEAEKQFIEYLSILNSILVGLKIDEYYFINSSPVNRLQPILPSLLPSLLSEIDEAEKQFIVNEILIPSYQNLYDMVLEQEKSWLPEIKLELAEIWINLSRADLAEIEIKQSVRGFYRNNDLKYLDANRIKEIAISSNKNYLTTLSKIIENIPSKDHELSLLKEMTKKIIKSYTMETQTKFSQTMSELDTLFTNSIAIVKENSSSNDLLKRLEFWYGKYQSQTFQIAVLALVKAGKSTFLNALLGKEFLPSASNPETAVPVKIIHNVEEEEGLLIHGDIKKQGSQEIVNYLREINDKKRNSDNALNTEIEIYAPFKALKNKDLGSVKFQVLDTPGFGEAETEKELRGSKTLKDDNQNLLDEISVVIYLLDYTKLKTKQEREVLSKLTNLRPDLMEKMKGKLFFIINKIDAQDRNGLSPEDAIDYVYELLKQHIPFLSKNQIFTSSAGNGLLARLAIDGNLNKEQKEDYRKKAFSKLSKLENDKELYKFIGNPELLGEPILNESQIPKIEDNIINFIYEKRGQILVQTLTDNLVRLLLEFQNKYVVTAEGVLSSNESKLGALEKKIRKTKNKQNRIDKETDKLEEELTDWINKQFRIFKRDTRGKINLVFDDKKEIPNNMFEKFFAKARKSLQSIFSSTTNKNSVTKKVNELNKEIFAELKENFDAFRHNLEIEILRKQNQFRNIEIAMNELAREAEGILNKSLDIEIQQVDIRLDKIDIDKIQEDTEKLLEKFVKTRTDKKRVSYEEKKYNEGSWCEGSYYTTETKYKTETEKVYSVDKKSIQKYWLDKIDEMNDNALDITQKLMRKQLKKELRRAKEILDNYIGDYLATIRNEKANIGDENSIIQRRKELNEIKLKIKHIFKTINIIKNR